MNESMNVSRTALPPLKINSEAIDVNSIGVLSN